MATFTWNGTSFDNQPFVASQFFTDPNGSLYFYEQNYNGFFPVTNPTDGTAPQLSAGALANGLQVGTVLATADSFSKFATDVATSIIATRRTTFGSNSQNILSSATQQTTSFVESAIKNAVASNQGLQTALQSAAGYLTSTDLNFVFNDIATGWFNGPQIIQTLASLINNHQLNITGATEALARVRDFKSRILKQVTDAADDVRKLQGQIDQWETSNTFDMLSQQFPTVFGPVKQLLDNQNKSLQQELSKLLPGTLASQVDAESFLTNIFNSVVGNKIPQILNPIDKLFHDIEYLSDQADGLINQIPVDGFGNLETQSSVCNQIAALLNNVVAKIPVAATIPAQNPVTAVDDIYQATTQYINQQLQTTVSQAQAQINEIAATIAKYGIKPASTPPPLDPTDSSKGGSFSAIIGAANLPTLPTVAPLTYNPPKISLSPDPTISANQNNRQDKQSAANAPGTQRNVKRGDCINNLCSDVPFKPKSRKVDGTLGDLQGSKNIPY